MKHLAAAVAALAFSPAIAAAAPLANLSTAPQAHTESSSPITGAVQVAVSQQTLPVGGKLPEHRHEALRYLYVVSGKLKVSDLVTGEEQVVEAGKMATEAAGDWHVAQVVGPTPVTLYVIDPTPKASD